MKEKSIRNKMFVQIISIILFIFCIITFINWQKDNYNNNQITTELNDLVSIETNLNDLDSIETDLNDTVVVILNQNDNIEIESDNLDEESTHENLNINIDFKTLLKKNSDTIGWIKFNNIDINYPIVQSTDNSYYLKHNFYKEKNKAGWIFADYNNTFPILNKNSIIYGHNRQNGTMFSKLNNYLKPDFCANESNQTFLFSTTQENYIANIFSVYKINKNGFTLQTNFENNIYFLDYLKELQEKSNYNFDVTLSPDDKIITLCTCDNNTKYRIVVHAKLKLLNN